MDTYTNDIIDQIKHYLSDAIYPYAVLFDGSWGIGKTFFVKSLLIPALNEDKSKNFCVKYVSVFGCNSIESVRDRVYETIVADWIDGVIDNALDGKAYGDVREDKKRKLKAGASLAQKISLWVLRKNTGIEIQTRAVLEEMIDLHEYFLILDDIERCTCDIKDLIGFLNQLIEHDGLKLLLVANEKEICQELLSEERELQLLVAAKDNVEIENPVQRAYANSYRDSSAPSKLTPEELNRRADVLFPQHNRSEQYLRIREKLIGMTIRYQPDLSSILHVLISQAKLSQNLSDVLKDSVAFFIDTMGRNDHNNLRTFQFYLSQIDFLYKHFCRMKFDADKRLLLLDALVKESFIVSLEFRANELKVDYSRLYNYGRTPGLQYLTFIRALIFDGIYDGKRMKQDLTRYLDSLPYDILEKNDPYCQLKESYYTHEQSWVEEQLRDLLTRLEHDSYPTKYFGEILVLLIRLTSIGFSRDYLSSAISSMCKCISLHPDAEKINIVWGGNFIEQKQIEEWHKAVSVINDKIREVSSAKTTRSIEEALEKTDWTVQLRRNAKKERAKSIREPFLSRISVEKLADKLMESKPIQLDEFRFILSDLYPGNAIYKTLKPDYDYIQILADTLQRKINENRPADLIVAEMLRCIIHDMQEIEKKVSDTE